MITSIAVDGFKTLVSFHLHLHQGLNILVGPNGSGKTNIVSFFEFLAHLIDSDASEATSRMGGAGAVFRKVGDTYQATLTATVFGCYKIEPSKRPTRHAPAKRFDNLKYALYEYGFSLLFSNDLQSVVFTKQHLKYKRSKAFVNAGDLSKENKDWDVVVEATIDLMQDLKTKATITTSDEALSDFIPFFFHAKDFQGRTKETEKFLAAITPANASILSSLSRFNPGLSPLLEDLTGGQTYNIIPSRIKLPEDSAKSPGIASDGSGLSATLYLLKRRQLGTHFRSWFDSSPNRKKTLRNIKLETLKSYFRLANDSIHDIDVTNEPFNNQLKVTFVIHSGEYMADVPLSFMSDGTLKWLALITAALTATSVFSIEEPENYLHPQMQAELIKIMREILFKEKNDSCSLMTTHSETVLNHCKPAELVVVSLRDGATVALRCQNQRELSQEIEKTGFGLGYYYSAGAIEDE